MSLEHASDATSKMAERTKRDFMDLLLILGLM